MARIITYQDFMAADDISEFVPQTVAAYISSDTYRDAVVADAYASQENVTIKEFVKLLYTPSGRAVVDKYAANNRICSNFFGRLTTQRVMYSLGNGVSFVQPNEPGDSDDVKSALGPDIDYQLIEAGTAAVRHGVSYLFWERDHVHVFKATEFVPLLDETDGSLKAGIRFWRLDDEHPVTYEVYEADGRAVYRLDGSDWSVVEEKTSYIVDYQTFPDGERIVVGERNWPSIPVVPMYGNARGISAIRGMRSAIDSYDIIRSGFANDLTDCAEVYWIVNGEGGMNESDLARFMQRLKLNHIVETDDGGNVNPYTVNVPYQARETYLQAIRSEIYENFGALDVHAVAAGATNDHIDAAYQPLDENAADFEHWVSEAIRQLLSLQGIDDAPVFRRARISNEKEQVEMVVMEAQWLDQATVLRKLPNIDPEEAQAILSGSEDEVFSRVLPGYGRDGNE